MEYSIIYTCLLLSLSLSFKIRCSVIVGKIKIKIAEKRSCTCFLTFFCMKLNKSILDRTIFLLFIFSNNLSTEKLISKHIKNRF